MLTFFISLFILYSVSRHDFVLLRQSISLRTVFDNAFITIILMVIVSRLAFILYTFSYDFLNPLKFFYLTRHWGILPYVGVLASLGFISLLFKKKKNKLRILDIYLISFTPVIILDVVLYANTPIFLAIKIVALAVLLVFYGWFIKIHNRFTTKDGFIASMTIFTYSLVTLAFSLAQNGVYSIKGLIFDVLLVGVILGSAFFLWMVQRDFFNK